MSGFRVERTQVVHQGPVVRTENVSIRTPDGEVIERQVIRHPGAVAVVAVHEGSVVLVEQYRAPLDRTHIEIPAGKCDVDGEPLTETARRELIEEVGLEPRSLVELGTFVTAAGFCDEAITIFGTADCREVEREIQGAEEAHMRVLHVPVGEIWARAASGELTDAKTLIGLLWANERDLLR